MEDYSEQEQDRAKYLTEILTSTASLKLIVAGAGTGKSYTFKQLLAQQGGENLALTLLNNLASELRQDLQQLAEARTFHSFCRKLLHRFPSDGIDGHFHFFPELKKIIQSDAKFLMDEFEDSKFFFDEAFQALIENDGRIDFFLDRANYYNSVGFDDSVYRVLLCFRADAGIIPEFNQLVVDEYQDFNSLEVEFIDHMRSKSPTLIVGDDDQAIYAFRNASPNFLRDKAARGEFDRFYLPYCSRCPQVIVEATNHIIVQAEGLGFLTGRIEKEYKCYMPDKLEDSSKYPHIIHARCTVHVKNAPYISRYIERIISVLPDEERENSIKNNYPLALVIGPSHYLKQINEYLEVKFANILYKTSTDSQITFIDAYECLLRNEESNLGWRIILELEVPQDVEESLLGARERQCDLIRLVSSDLEEKHRAFLNNLRKLITEFGSISDQEKADLELLFGTNVNEIINHFGVPADSSDYEHAKDNTAVETPDIASEPVVQLTNYNGCKGLSAGYVFVVGFEGGVFPRKINNPTDSEICQLVVALTRARKECHVISVGRFAGKLQHPSIFLGWLPQRLVKSITVNKAYFENG